MGNISSSAGAATTDLKDLLSSPFRSNMDLFAVFLAVGLVMVTIVLWTRILAHIGE